VRIRGHDSPERRRGSDGRVQDSFAAPANGLRFLATASVLRAGKRLCFCSGEVRAIRESGEELVATMLSTIIIKTV
jgi:acyl-coenzyme A thioesterase PaaI-like protein